MISGAFSVTQQAMHLGFIPRLRIQHTSEAAVGQIYIPVVNWTLMVMVIAARPRSSGPRRNLAAAYGIAVTGAMFIDTCLLAVVLFALWNWKPAGRAADPGRLLPRRLAYFAANLTKVPDGGWFPLLVGFIAFTLLTTWAKGRQLMTQRMSEAAMPASIFIKSAPRSATRVPGTAVFMTTARRRHPARAAPQPQAQQGAARARAAPDGRDRGRALCRGGARRFDVEDLGQGFFRLTLRFGFMQETNVPSALARVDRSNTN